MYANIKIYRGIGPYDYIKMMPYIKSKNKIKKKLSPGKTCIAGRHSIRQRQDPTWGQPDLIVQGFNMLAKQSREVGSSFKI